MAHEGPNSSDPIDIAMEAGRADASLDGPAREVLRKHGRLLDWQIASERLSVALKLMTAAAGLAAAIGLGALVWNAAHDHGLVVESFQSSPQDAARGLNGTVLASKLLDRIAAMDARSNSVRASDTYENNWGDDLKVEIAQTGVTLPDLQRFLRSWLGRQTRVTGELVRDGSNLTLTVRAGARSAFTVTGADADIDRMIETAAERMFAETQPYQYSKYLENHGRAEEALAVARNLAIVGPQPERVWAYAQISNLLASRGDLVASREAGRRAVALDPKNALAQINYGAAEAALGHDEAALKAQVATVRLLDSGGAGLSGAAKAALPTSNRAGLAQFYGDLAGAVRLSAGLEDLPSVQGSDRWVPLLRANYLAQRHDTRSSRAVRAMAADPAAELDIPGQLVWNSAPFVTPVLEAAEVEDWAGMAAAAQRLRAATAGGGRFVAEARLRFLDPRLAVAKAHAGDAAGALLLVKALPLDCYPCLRARGKVAALAGQAAEADRWYAEAVRQGPSLPFAYSEWGEAKLAAGDLEGAIRLFRLAEDAGPRFADPLKFEGDALARQGEPRAAARKYAAAGQLAPRWGALQAAWGRSLSALGRADEARARFAAAANLDLSPADRAAVQRALGART